MVETAKTDDTKQASPEPAAEWWVKDQPGCTCHRWLCTPCFARYAPCEEVTIGVLGFKVCTRCGEKSLNAHLADVKRIIEVERQMPPLEGVLTGNAPLPQEAVEAMASIPKDVNWVFVVWPDEERVLSYLDVEGSKKIRWTTGGEHFDWLVSTFFVTVFSTARRFGHLGYHPDDCFEKAMQSIPWSKIEAVSKSMDAARELLDKSMPQNVVWALFMGPAVLPLCTEHVVCHAGDVERGRRGLQNLSLALAGAPGAP